MRLCGYVAMAVVRTLLFIVPDVLAPAGPMLAVFIPAIVLPFAHLWLPRLNSSACNVKTSANHPARAYRPSQRGTLNRMMLR